MKRGHIIILISLTLTALIVSASSIGLFIPGFYDAETPNWAAQSWGQDMANLLLAMPLLVVTAILASGGNRTAFLLWGGSLFYLVYTYVIYSFALHFNELFVVYCLILGLSFYGFIYFLVVQVKEPLVTGFSGMAARVAGIYLVAVGLLFYVLWLLQIIPAQLSHGTPDDLGETGLFINPVHALDLSVCLPGLILTGFLLITGNRWGGILAPAMLVFCILMDLTIALLVVVMQREGIRQDLSTAYVMSVLAGVSAFLLIWLLKTRILSPHRISL